MKYVGELLAYAAFAAFVGLLSIWPQYRLLAPQEAIISLSFSHAGLRVGECRTYTQEELNELPPNMRKPTECPRERHPVHLTLTLDDKLLFEETLLPSGIWQDGKSNVYSRMTVDAGTRHVRVTMNDSGTVPSVDYERDSVINISAGQNLLINFDGLNGNFVIHQGTP
jgi:hypothetical protein